jgi:hypothetical protein
MAIFLADVRSFESKNLPTPLDRGDRGGGDVVKDHINSLRPQLMSITCPESSE